MYSGIISKKKLNHHLRIIQKKNYTLPEHYSIIQKKMFSTSLTLNYSK